MADISAILALLPEITEIHVVSVRNECKEVLLVIDSTLLPTDNNPMIYCVNIESSGDTSVFSFRMSEEKQLPHSTPCEKISRYLYEPNSSILKAGAYKVVAMKYGVDKLQINSHLYTSDVYIPDFPGRKFEVIETVDFNA